MSEMLDFLAFAYISLVSGIRRQINRVAGTRGCVLIAGTLRHFVNRTNR